MRRVKLWLLKIFSKILYAGNGFLNAAVYDAYIKINIRINDVLVKYDELIIPT